MSGTEVQNNVNANLEQQDISQLDISKLTPLSPEVISRQATINIGTIGHVAHGKSTVVKAISGVQTVRFKNELERNITIKLERIPCSELYELTQSPRKLREFIRIQDKKFGKPPRYSPYGVTDGIFEEMKKEKIRQFINRDYFAPSVPIKKRRFNFDENLITRDLNYSDCESISSRTESGRYDADNYEISSWRDIWRIRHLSLPTNGKKVTRDPDEYVVEKVEEINERGHKPIFFVKWRGYGVDENTWEPLENISSCAKFSIYVEEQVELHAAAMDVIFAKIMEEAKSCTSPPPNESTETFTVADAEGYDCIAHILDLILLAVFKDSGYRNKNKEKIIIDRFLRKMKVIPFYHKRRQQLYAISIWRNTINNIEPALKVDIENSADFGLPPNNFHYIKRNIAGENVVIPEEPPIGCECEEGCSYRSGCCAKMSGSEFPYNAKGKLRVPPRTPIFECNKRCSCGPDCVNRVVQNGLKDSLSIFKTADGRGWGVKARKIIYAGEFICEYVGEVITGAEAEKRGKAYDAEGLTYLFDLDFNEDSDSIYSIDAANYGNISHFINHSCEPNCGVWPVWVDCLDPNLPRLAIFSLRRIEVGEELTFDYTNQDNRRRQLENTLEYDENQDTSKKTPCLCGSKKCRKYLF